MELVCVCRGGIGIRREWDRDKTKNWIVSGDDLNMYPTGQQVDGMKIVFTKWVGNKYENFR